MMHPEDYLKLIKKLNVLIRNKEFEKQELFTISTKMTQDNDGMPHAPGVSDKVGNLSVKLLMKEQEIDHVIDVLVDLKDEIISQIDKLPADECDVIYSFYIMNERISDIAERREQSDTWIKNLKNRGISYMKVIESEAYKEACRLLFSE